jgi:hypothetical protein
MKTTSLTGDAEGRQATWSRIRPCRDVCSHSRAQSDRCNEVLCRRALEWPPRGQLGSRTAGLRPGPDPPPGGQRRSAGRPICREAAATGCDPGPMTGYLRPLRRVVVDSCDPEALSSAMQGPLARLRERGGRRSERVRLADHGVGKGRPRVTLAAGGRVDAERGEHAVPKLACFDARAVILGALQSNQPEARQKRRSSADLERSGGECWWS